MEALSLFTEELMSDDLKTRVNNIYRLRIVITLLNKDQIQQHVIPMIEKIMEKQDDEVLFALAKELGLIYNYLPNFQVKIFDFLCSLCEKDETVIRDQAVQSILQISKNMTQAQISNKLAPQVLNFLNNEQKFTIRIVGIQLFLTVYQKQPEFKTILQNKFIELANEETPMVRKAIAQIIGDIAQACDSDFLIKELIPQYKKLVLQDQDSIRIICLNQLDIFIRLLSKDDNRKMIASIIIQIQAIKSWKTRQCLGKNFAHICQEFKNEFQDITASIFNQLIQDPETEVKQALLESLAEYMQFFQNEKNVHSLILAADQLLNSGPSVRVQYVEKLTKILPMLPSDMIPNFKSIISEIGNDEDLNVRVAFIKLQEQFIAKFGTKAQPKDIALKLKSLGQDNRWRVRYQVIESACEILKMHLTKQFNDPGFNPQILFQTYYDMFEDRVSYVREGAIARIPFFLALEAGVGKELLNTALKFIANKDNYLLRASGLYCLQELGQKKEYVKEFLPQLETAMKDPVPNVRFVAVKVLKALVGSLETEDKSRIQRYIFQFSGLKKMEHDPDQDVVFYVKEALTVYL